MYKLADEKISNKKDRKSFANLDQSKIKCFVLMTFWSTCMSYHRITRDANFYNTVYMSNALIVDSCFIRRSPIISKLFVAFPG